MARTNMVRKGTLGILKIRVTDNLSSEGIPINNIWYLCSTSDLAVI